MRQAVAAYLDCWRAAGIGEGFNEAGTDWFALGGAAPPAAAPAQKPSALAPASPKLAPPAVEPARVSPAPLSKPLAALDPAAREAVSRAATLDELQILIQAFEGCALKPTAKSLCFYRGASQARLMLIGEAPGREEDLEGRPFVGRAGQLLDRMLATIGIDETKVHIANTVYWRPPGNRTPTPEETLACMPFVQRQMELVAPEVVVLLGGVAAKSVLGLTDGILRLRGKWRKLSIGGREVRALATLHPAYLLRTPAAKRQAWQDLLIIEAALAAA